ncbi:MAG: DUF4838 domain-containing protein [Victivallales bacterium]|nr:DUF4838 domain-containing protein [Victivallales bacterium]MBT7164103.1 DUF4838 domain-containing protein [Victivallales bacterium]
MRLFHAAVASLLLASWAEAAELPLAVDGKTDYVIVTPVKPSLSVQRAAQELQTFLGQITGAEYRVVTTDTPVQPHEIVLGVPARLGVTADMKALGPEGYVLRTVGESLLIAGSDMRGVMYGAYGLLEEHLGCRWFTPTVSKIPKQKTLRLPELNQTVIPVLEYRWPAVRDCYNADWTTRNRVNVGPELKAEHGGSVTFCGWAHTFEALVPQETHFDEHPEYFALVDGKRLRGRTQLCCTNEEVIQLAIKGIRERMRTHPDATYFSVSQNDWGNQCQCKPCQDLATREGSQMGPVLQLVNRVAAAVAKDFPDKRVTTLAYQWSRKPPKTIRPLPNVTIRLCTIECCFSHAFTKCDYPQNAQFAEDIKGWSAICNNLWIWNYTTNFRSYYLPHPVLRPLNDDIKFFIAHNVKGIYEQDTKLTLNGDMSELGAYIMAKFLWNADYDEDTAINEFLAGVYGKATPHVRAYIDLLHDTVAKDNVHLRCFMSTKQASYLTKELLAKADQFFEQAEAAVKGQPDVLQRAEFLRLPVDYAMIERFGRTDNAPAKVNHKAFTVTPLTDIRANVDRFLTRGKQANILSMSERRFTLADYRKSVLALRDRKLTPHQPIAADGVQPGVRAKYFQYDAWPRGKELEQLEPTAETVVPQIDLSTRKRDKMFGFLFDGLIHAPADGIYTFHLKAESGSYLHVAGEAVIDSKRAASSHSVQGHVALRAGWHPIRLRFREYSYNDGLNLTWEVPNQKRTKILPKQFGHLAE